MKNIIERILSAMAAAIIKKYKPTIVAITGSAGKTSAREAIFAAIKTEFDARSSIKNYNNELGLPLSIINAKAAGKNALGWLKTILRGAALLVFPFQYPKVLVLEMAADRPGDLAKLVLVAPPDLSVITSVGATHIEFFGSESAIAEEKSTLVRALSARGTAILNADDPRVVAMQSLAKGRVITYGIKNVADVRATKIEYLRDPQSLAVVGLTAEVKVESKSASFAVMGGIGKNYVLSALAGLSAAKALGVKLETSAMNLEKMHLAPGRMRLVPGIKKITIIDDTYNASPTATLDAISALGDYPLAGSGRRIAILGDMLELGGYAESAHKEIGALCARLNIDYLYAVGEKMHYAAHAACAAGMPEDHVIHMENAGAAARFLQERLHQDDVVLIKGSQGMRMERAVKELMAEPERASELLCRQTDGWDA